MYKKTNGKRVYVDGLEMYLPVQPPLEQIDGFRLPKEKQKWVWYDVDKGESPLPEWYKELRAKEYERQLEDPEYYDAECEAYRVIEFERCKSGYWFMNNGEPTYITGSCYFFLRWCRFDIGYSKYYEFIRDNFYFRQYCQEDPKCFGYLILKGRGIGGTLEEVCTQLWNMSACPKNRNALIQSKNDDDAVKILTEKTVLIYKNLPHFLQPISSSSDNPKNGLFFELDAVKGKNKILRLNSKVQIDELRNKIEPINSGIKAADGRTIHDFICDEMGKPSRTVDVLERHSVNRKCVERFGRKIGILRCPTTVEEIEEGRGNSDYESLWKQSNQLERNSNGRTSSGLYRRFLPVFKTAAYVDNMQNFDEYGKINEDFAKDFYDREAMGYINDPKSFASFRRKHPNCIEDCFGQHNNDCEFNILILQHTYKKIVEEIPKQYRGGKMEWVERFRKVKWVDDEKTKPKWHISYLPSDPNVLNQIHQTTYDYDKKVYRIEPRNDERFAISCDPIDKIKGEGYNSDAAATVFMHFDRSIDNFEMFQEYCNLDEYLLAERKYEDKYNFTTHNYIADYLQRPEDPEEFFEDMAKACIFFGCKILIERNTSAGLINYFKRVGMGDFIMTRPRSSWTKPNTNDFGLGVPASSQLIGLYVSLGKNYVNRHGHRLKLPRIVEGLLHFDSVNTTIHDTAVATLLNQFNIKHLYQIKEENKNIAKISINIYGFN